MKLLQRVETAIRRYGLLRHGDRVLVAVSGGPDSVALLHLLTRLQPAWQLQLHVMHVNHGLRADAAVDAAFVMEAGRSLGVPVTVTEVDVRAQRRGGESIQEAARRLRFASLLRTARDIEAWRIALGHHADDQAETVLLRLLRGAGTTGLGGMRPLRGPFIRPLLDISRADIEQYCSEHRLDVLHDPSNQSDVYVRNRIRLQLLPLLAAEYNPNITERLVRTAQLLRADDAVLQSLATRAYRHARLLAGLAGDGAPVVGGPPVVAGDAVPGPLSDETTEHPGLVALSVTAVREHAYALRRRIVRHALRDARADLRRITHEHTDAVVALLDDAAVGALTLPGSVRVERQADVLLFSSRAGRGPRGSAAASSIGPARRHAAVTLRAPLEAERTLNVPGRTQLAPGIVVEATFEAPEAFAEGGGPVLAEAWFDRDTLAPPLVVRRRVDGDRIRPLGLGGTKKLQDLFVDEKVPRHMRDRVPLVADRDGIVWVPGLRTAERVAVGPDTKRVLYVRITSL